jgi:TonB family protein
VKTQDVLISVLLHLVFFAVIVIFSAARGRARQFDPEDIATVQLFESVPMGGQAPERQEPESVEPEPVESKLPDMAVNQIVEDFVEEEPVQIASIETPYEIEKKAARKPPKPKPKPEKTESKPTKSAKKKTVIGDGEVETSIGSGGASGGLGVGDFPYDIGRVTQLIDHNWDNPVLSQKTLACVVYFQVDRSGNIRGATIETSSGNSQFDMTALSAVMRTKTLPPLPVSFNYDILGFHLEFEYTP